MPTFAEIMRAELASDSEEKKKDTFADVMRKELDKPLSRQNLRNMGITAKTNAQQRKDIGNVLRRRGGTPFQEFHGVGMDAAKIRESAARGAADVAQAIKETPENIKIGTIGLGASALFALKRRGIQLAGGGAIPDEAVLHQFEPVTPTKEKPSMRIPGLIEPPRTPLPGALTAEAFGLVTRLPHVGGKILGEKAAKLAESQDKATLKDAPITKLMRSVTQSGVPSMGAAIGASLLTGDVHIGLALLGELEGGSAFQTQLEAGGSIMKANVIADLSEAVEIGTELLVLPRLVKGVKEGIPLKQALRLVGENATQEGAAGFSQRFLEVVGLETTKGTNLRDAVGKGLNEGIKAVPENAWVGGATASAAAMVRGGFDVAKTGIEKAKELRIPTKGLTPEAIEQRVAATELEQAINEQLQEPARAVGEAPTDAAPAPVTVVEPSKRAEVPVEPEVAPPAAEAVVAINTVTGEALDLKVGEPYIAGMAVNVRAFQPLNAKGKPGNLPQNAYVIEEIGEILPDGSIIVYQRAATQTELNALLSKANKQLQKAKELGIDTKLIESDITELQASIAPPAAEAEAFSGIDLTTLEGRTEAGKQANARGKEIATFIGLKEEVLISVDAGGEIRGVSHPGAGMVDIFAPEGATQDDVDKMLIHELGHQLFPKTEKGIGGRLENERKIDKFTEKNFAQWKAHTAEAKPKKGEPGFVELPFETPSPERIREGAERTYQHFVNRFASIENAVKKAQKLGADIKVGENPALRAREYLGIGHKVGTTLERATFRITKEGQIEVTGEGLKPILNDFDRTAKPVERKRAKREKDLQDYLVAQRTILDLQRPPHEGAKRNIASPKQVQEAQTQLDRIKAKYGDEGVEGLESTANRLYAYQRRVLRLLVDSGNLSRKQYNTIVARNRHYIPFDRVLEDVIPTILPRGKKAFTEARAPVRKIKGSELEVQPIIESVIKNTYRIMDAAERNTVARSVVKLGNVLVEEITPVHVKMTPIKVDPREILTAVREFRSKSRKVTEEIKTVTEGGETDIAGPAKKLEKVVADALTHRGFSEGEAKSFIAQIRKGKVEGKPQGAHTTETIRQLVRETERIIKSEVPLETTIFRASQFKPKGRVIEYFDNGKRKFAELSPNLFEAMSGLQELSSTLMVRLLSKPAHWLRIGATITPEFMLRNPIRDQFTAWMQTSFGFIPFVDSVGAIADVLGKTELYHDWLRSGGAYSGFVELNRPALKKAVDALRDSPGRKLLRKLNVIADAQDISQLFEQATRVGVFKAARRRGISPVEAGFASREATVDFARRGSQLKDVNQVIAFFNAGIQGLDKSIRNFINSPGSTAMKASIAITLPALLLYLRNRKDPEYKEIPRWQRDLFFVFKVGGTWIRIPKPFLYGQIFGTLPERFMEYADTRDPESFDKLTNSIYDSVLPISGDAEAGLLATAIKPLIENAVNHSFFLQRPIVPESKKALIASEQYGRYTSEAAKQLGKWTNYSPSKIENLIRGWFGGTGRYALEATDALANAIKAEGKASRRPSQLADIPLIKGFVTRPPESVSESVNKFYERYEEIQSAYMTWRSLMKQGRQEDAARLRAKYPNLPLANSLREVASHFSDITKAIDQTVQSTAMTEAQKRQRIKELNSRRVAIARVVNERLRAKK